MFCKFHNEYWTIENGGDCEPFYPNMMVDVCPDCNGDSDPIDDMYYCSTCSGRGWVYEQMLDSPYHSHQDIERWHKEEVYKYGEPDEWGYYDDNM